MQPASTKLYSSLDFFKFNKGVSPLIKILINVLNLFNYEFTTFMVKRNTDHEMLQEIIVSVRDQLQILLLLLNILRRIN